MFKRARIAEFRTNARSNLKAKVLLAPAVCVIESSLSHPGKNVNS